MKIRAWCEDTAQTIVDSLMSLVPRQTPPPDLLARAKIICHRGINPGYTENTLEAFDAAVRAGVWGIEFDVRFTKDGVPVVHHDKSLRRIHDVKFSVEKITFEKLRAVAPRVPSLQELVDRFGKRTHLMMEVKPRRSGFTNEHVVALQKVMSKLEPIRDYHVMALRTKIFDAFPWMPRKACLTISTSDTFKMARITIKKNYGGHTGYYVLLTNSLINRHKAHGQIVGTGFICSKSILFREINRGVELLYSNQSISFQEIINDLLKSHDKTKLNKTSTVTV
jgi:glycerophosphoryl diester phosphodiesterase